MKLGLALPVRGESGDPGRIPEFAREAESMGFDSLWANDRLLAPTAPSDPYPGEPQPYPADSTFASDPVVALSAAAAVTSRVRLGSSTLNATWYSPVVLARALTTLDVLSRGRLDAGFGIGWMRDEYRAAGVEWESRGCRLDETLGFLDEWWTSNPVEFHGEFVDVPPSVVDLRPHQPGGPPIQLGGLSTRAMERVGRRANGYLAVHGLPEEFQSRLWNVARRAAEAAGRDPDGLASILRVDPLDGAVEPLAAQFDAAHAAGHDTVFFDFVQCTRNADEALDLAGALVSRLQG